jgi:chemotaxis protein CheD
MSVLAAPRVGTAAEGWVTLNLGEWKVSANERDVLTCLGLGSCVAFCAHDPQAGVAGMAHMVLPSSSTAGKPEAPKFIDVAVPLVVEHMERQGAQRDRIVCHLVGGAHILMNTTTELAQVGDRNIAAAREAVQTLGLRVRGEDVGGSKGRTVRLFVGSGALEVAQAGGESRTLSKGRS